MKLVILFIGIIVISSLMQGEAWTIILIVGGIGLIIAVLRQAEKEAKLKEELKKDTYDEITKVIDKHIKVLARKQKQLTTTDEYGHTSFNHKKWEKEVTYFVENVVMKEVSFTSGEYELEINFGSLIDSKIETFLIKNPDNIKLEFIDEQMDGLEYEHFCSDLFIASGWKTSVTKSTGDQGADIIIYKNNLSAVVQCKRYSSPVGNKAVQEVYAAKKFYDTDFAIVVTNSTYTDSAKTLAHSLNVKLIHHDDIKKSE